MKHVVSLCGSYGGADIEGLFKSLSTVGVLQMSLVGREVTLQVRSNNLDHVKKSLKSYGVSNINLLEWRKAGVTLSGSGKGMDEGKKVSVSLIPSNLDENLRPLAFLCEYEMNERLLKEVGDQVEEILHEAGVTDALYTIHVRKKMVKKELLEAVTAAALNAVFSSGGVTNIE